MCRETFTLKVQRHGLWKPGLSYDAVLEMGELIKCPSPMVTDKSRSPCVLKKASVLIAAGYARLNHEAWHYEATDEGRTWHARVMKILNQHTA